MISKARQGGESHIFIPGHLLAIALLTSAFSAATANAIAQGAGSIENNLQLASEYRRQGRFDDAEQLYRQIIENHPDSPEAYNGLGFLFTMKGDFERAIEKFKKAARLNPDWARPLYHIGWCYTELGHHTLAEQYLIESLILDPSDASTHNALGILFARRGRDEDAVNAYNRALQLRPDWTAPHENLVLLYDSRGLYRESQKHLREILRIDPENRNALYKQVEHVAGGWGNWKVAESFAGKLAALHPNWAPSHEAMGIVMLALGRLDEAEAAFNRALSYDEMSAAARLGLGRIRMQQGEYAQSEAEYGRALDIDPSLREARDGIEMARHNQTRHRAGGCSRATPSHGSFAGILYYLALPVPALLLRRRNKY